MGTCECVSGHCLLPAAHLPVGLVGSGAGRAVRLYPRGTSQQAAAGQQPRRGEQSHAYYRVSLSGLEQTEGQRERTFTWCICADYHYHLSVKVEAFAPVLLSPGESFVAQASFDPVISGFSVSLDSGEAAEFALLSPPSFERFSVEGPAEINFAGFVEPGEERVTALPLAHCFAGIPVADDAVVTVAFVVFDLDAVVTVVVAFDDDDDGVAVLVFTTSFFNVFFSVILWLQ